MSQYSAHRTKVIAVIFFMYVISDTANTKLFLRSSTRCLWILFEAQFKQATWQTIHAYVYWKRQLFCTMRTNRTMVFSFLLSLCERKESEKPCRLLSEYSEAFETFIFFVDLIWRHIGLLTLIRNVSALLRSIILGLTSSTAVPAIRQHSQSAHV